MFVNHTAGNKACCCAVWSIELL